MIQGQRKRRSWFVASALYASPVALLGLIGAVAGLPPTIVSPYQSALQLLRGGSDAPTQSLASSSDANGASRVKLTGKAAAASGKDRAGKARLAQARPGGGATPQVLARQDGIAVSGPGEDDIHPAWDQIGNSFVWSSTRLAAAKILPEPLEDPPDPPLPTSPLLNEIPQYSVFINPPIQRDDGVVSWLTRRTGSQFYPNLDALNNLLIYVTSPEAVVPPEEDPTDPTDPNNPPPPPLTGPTPRPNQDEPPPIPPAPPALPWTLEIIATDQIPVELDQVAPRLRIQLPGIANVQKPVWSPDGRAFIFSGQNAGTGNWDLYYGSVTPGLLQKEWDEDDPATQATAQPQISIVQFTGAVGGVLNDPNQPDEVDPVWSPDGRWIAFTRGKVLLHGLAAGETAGGTAPGRVLEDVPISVDPRRAYLEYQSGHIWIAPVNSTSTTAGGFSMTAGRPRRITGFSVLRPGATTPVTAMEYLPAWTPGLGLGFTSNRLDINGDRIPDDVATADTGGMTTSIFTVFNGTEQEAAGAPIILSANTPAGIDVVQYIQGRNVARKETFSIPAPESTNEEYPSFNPNTPVPAEFNIDLIYQMDLESVQTTPNPPLAPDTILHDIWRTVSSATSDNVFDLQGLPVVTPRLAPPGSPVKIEAAVKPRDLNLRINVAEVTAILRDPDQKVFANLGFAPMVNDIATSAIHETGAQTVDTVPLFDDGLPEHGDAVAGDGIFTNIWATPGLARDYYLDIAVRGDRAFGGPGIGGFAFDYFDNAWGFSTRRFEQTANLLFVSDHTAGQKFIHERTGTSARRAYTIFPVESYFTSRPMPESAVVGDETFSIGSFIHFPGPTVGFPGFGPERATDVLGPNSPYGDEYDVWRTQCRDTTLRIPPGGSTTFYQGQSLQDAINQYLPRPVNSFTREGRARQIQYADRGIVWASPYTGDITEQTLDTIRNPAVQQMLMNYLDEGGRMILTGQDVAWSLTNNTRLGSNRLLNDYFHIDYLDDADADIILGGVTTNNRHYLNSTGAIVTDPLPYEPWGFHWTAPDAAAGSLKNWWPTTPVLAPAFGIVTEPPYSDTETQLDGALNQALIDGITGRGDPPDPGAGSGILNLPGPPSDSPVRQFGYVTSQPFPVTDTIPREAAYIYRDSRTGYKVAYFAFGMEGVARHFEVVWENSFVFTGNRPAQIMHNGVCWMRQGGISGRVSNVVQFGRPIPGAIVLAYIPTIINNQEEVVEVAGAAVTDEQGNYTIPGLEPSVYRLTVLKPGFAFEHIQHVAVHGGHTTTGDPDANLAMTPVPPGDINVTVLGSSGQPVAGVRVEARLVGEVIGTQTQGIENGPVYTETTNGQGIALIRGVEIGIYEVSVKVDGRVVALRGDVRVQSNRQTNVSLTISGSLQTVAVSGRVTNANGDPVAGIQVVAQGSTGQAASALTNPNGVYSFRLAPGDYTIQAITGAGVQASKNVTVGASPATVDLVLGQTDPGPGNPTTITIPAGVSMISLPESFNGQDFSAVFNQPGFNVATWIGASYALYPNAPARNVEAGRGYFVKLAQPVTLTVPAQTNTGTRQIALNLGWNMFGSPFSTTLPISNLRIGHNGQQLTLQAAAQQGLIDITIWGLAGREYAQASSLEVGKGYWIHARQQGVTLLMLPPSTTTATSGERIPLPEAAATLSGSETNTASNTAAKTSATEEQSGRATEGQSDRRDHLIQRSRDSNSR